MAGRRDTGYRDACHGNEFEVGGVFYRPWRDGPPVIYGGIMTVLDVVGLYYRDRNLLPGGLLRRVHDLTAGPEFAAG